jgi:hypothetical protein
MRGKLGLNFGASWPTAHTLACLHIAGRVTAPVARLTADSGGLRPRVGWDLHPMDDIQGFTESSHTLLPPDQPFLAALD